MEKATLSDQEVAGNQEGSMLIKELEDHKGKLDAQGDRITDLENRYNLLVTKMVKVKTEVEDLNTEMALLKPWQNKGLAIRKRTFETWFRDREITPDTPQEDLNKTIVNVGKQVAHKGNILADWALCVEDDADIRYITNFKRAYGVELPVVKDIRYHEKLVEICNLRAMAMFRQRRGECTEARHKLIQKVDEALAQYARTPDVAGSLYAGPLSNLVDQVRNLKKGAEEHERQPTCPI